MTALRVVVAGGGVVGMAAAYELASHGCDVTMLEPAMPGQATAAGAGIISPGSRWPPSDVVLPLVRAAIGFLPELLERLAEDGERETGYAITGGLHVAFGEDEVPLLDGVLAQVLDRAASAFPGVGSGELLDGDEARSLFPPLSREVHAAVLMTGSGRLDGRLLRAALEAACRKRGARVIPAAASLVRDGAGVAVDADGERIAADSVVLAAGAWAGPLLAPLGVRLPVYPQRGQIAHLALPGVDTSRWPVVLGFHSHYLLAFPPDRIVGGATREDESAFDRRVTAGGVREVLSEALRVAPGLGSATLDEMRVGFRPAMPDHTPAIGRVPGVDNLVVATGHGGYGLQLGPFSGAIAARLAMGDDPPIDLTPYDPARFTLG